MRSTEPVLLPGREDVAKGCFVGPVPEDFAVVGRRALSPAEQVLTRSEGTTIFQNAEHVRAFLYEHWRSLHDRDALQAERALASATYEKRKAERRQARTLPRMLRERPLAHWSEHWPTRVVREAHRIFRDATRDLLELGDGGGKRARVAVLKRIVTELNALDDTEGCIETSEREELVARIEALAALVGVTNDDEALTGHRDW